MKKVIYAIGGGALVIVLGLAALGTYLGGGAAARGPDVERIGYFKDDRNNRVLAFCADGVLSREEAGVVFEALPYTDGASLLATISRCDAGSDTVTHAADFGAASASAQGGDFASWGWRLRINAAGARTIDSQ